MSDSRAGFLLELMEDYKDEADKCGKAGAYLAGCIMLGTAIEASLLAMGDCYPEELEKSKIYRQKESENKESRKRELLYSLDLYELSKIAVELGWIPSKVPLNKTARESGISPDDALSKGDVGYFVDVAREIRNLVHPGRHVRLWKGVHISKQYYQFCYEITEVVIEHLLGKIEDSIQKSIPEKK